MAEWLIEILGLPAEALKAIGTILVGGILALATYVASRIKEARRPAEQTPAFQRISLDPADRDLGFTLIRTGTDLTRALHDHGEILRGLGSGGGGSTPPAAPHHAGQPGRRNRSRT